LAEAGVSDAALLDPASNQTAIDDAHLVEAVAETVERSPLDQATAAILHRDATPGAPHRPAPKFDPRALMPVAVMVVGVVATFVVLAFVR
jgi:hypothetical protein